MLATSEPPLQSDASKFQIEAGVSTEPTPKAPLAPVELSRTEMVRDALRLGTPLHRLEEYFDWLDM